MKIELYFILISAAWTALLLYPRFTGIQLWKTVLAGFCSFCPLLMIGVALCQKMGYPVSWELLNILVVAFFTLTPLSCLTALIWNIVDIARYSKKPTESKELLRAWGQLAVWAVFVVYLLFVCGPVIVGIGC
ncbi:MAG: hypothetical protein J5806_13580 [Lentisphaeria bacterium]|nr:hypothetical protein [Lentisphaeria bacterium]